MSRLSASCAAGTHHCGAVRCDCHCHVVELCVEPGCRRLARRLGGWCELHAPRPVEPVGVAFDLTDEQLANIRAQVEADAMPLFVAALGFILAQSGVVPVELVATPGPLPSRELEAH